jgi:hypothetical protein
MKKYCNRIATAFQVDRGALLATMAFILVATGMAALMLGFFLSRSSSDYAAAQRANAKSAITQYSAQLLGKVNGEFPSDWQTLPPDELKEATSSLSDFDELRTEVWVDGFSINVTTGVVVVALVGETTTLGRIAVQSSMKLIPSGAAVFKGVDSNSRPIWIYSDDENLGALALWELAPDGMQYLDVNGSSSPTAPAEIPAIGLNGTDDGVRADIGSVSCRYGQYTDYQYRTNPGTGYGAWADWSTTQRFDFALDEGEYIQMQARARCVAPGAPGISSPTSPAQSYVKPITTVLAGPQVTVSTAGEAVWPAVVCSASASPEYRYQRALNDGPYNAWSAWSATRAFSTVLPEGNLLEVQVQARCVTPHTTGPNSSTGYASAISPLETRATKPVVAISAGLSAAFSGADCPAGTSVEYRWHSAANDAPMPTTWGAWSRAASAALTADEGSRIAVQAEARCATAYATGPAGPVSSTTTRDMDVTSVAGHPTVSLATNGGSFTWTNSSCPSGTSPLYDWDYQANGGAVVSSAGGWKTKPTSVAVTINQGGTLRVWIKAACQGYTDLGPASAVRTSDFSKPITSAPSTPAVSLNSTTAASWSAGGCPTGTTVQTRWRNAVNGGSYQSYSGWGTTSATGDLVGYDTRTIVSVSARCVNTETDQYGPTSYGESPWVTRGIPQPSSEVTGWRGDESGQNRRVYWNAVSCAAGTPLYEVRLRHSTIPDKYTQTWSTTYSRQDLARGGWTYYAVQTQCRGNYAVSRWSGFGAEYVPR